MNLSIVESIRTNNFNDPEILKKIQAIWSNSIPKIKDSGYQDNIYGVYHEYDSNYQGDYTLSIMIENKVGVLNLSEENYKIFIVDKPDGEGIYQTW
ncbi:hypothetical protein [Apibacter muscae]|uniref:hypothetical protein n=1 Tax=Apibacter muscae TaxID=2509004 RepID=UPI001C88BAA8|nr:hypothetical protein [Apibacter muscae]